MKKVKYYFLLFTFLFFFQRSFSQSTLYARMDGNWSNNSTWSIITPGGISCTCTPTAVDSIVISGYSVIIDVDGGLKSLTIENSSTLTFNNSIGLDINAGTVTVKNGGTLTHGGSGSNAHIDFETGTNGLSVESGATYEMEDINIAGSTNLTFSGAGNIDLTDDILYNGSDSNLTNSLSGVLNLTGPGLSSLWFTTASSDCSFINNGTVNIDRLLFIQGLNSIITNNGTINLTNSTYGIGMTSNDATGTIINNAAGSRINIAGTFAVSNNQMTFNNFGILDLEGDLNGWSNTAPSEFYNQSGSSLYFAGTGQFSGNFYSDYDANTVVFDNTLSLQNELITPADNYWHLTFSGFQKQMKSDITCKGNFKINTPAFVTTSRIITMDNAGTLTIASGGSLSNPSGAGTLTFIAGHTYSFIVNDATNGYTFNRIVIVDNATVNILGTGKIDIGQDLFMLGASSTINNNFTGSFNARGLVFSSASSGNTFVNNQTIDFSGDAFISGSNNTLSNDKNISFGDDIIFDATSTGPNIFATGTGSMTTITDDINFNVTNATLTNGGTMTLDRLFFNAASCTLNTSGTITASGALEVSDPIFDNSIITINSGGILNITGELHLSNADFTLNNSGIVNLTGRFDDMGGTEQINNLSGGTFNYAGVENMATHFNISLFTSAAGNTYNYNSSGNQDIIIPTDGSYWNLTLSGSGNKIMEPVGTENINGAISINGTANFDVNTNSVNLTIAGDWSNTGGTFGEGTSTVTFDGSSGQIISTTGGEVFYNLINSNTSGNIILASNLHVDNGLTLTNGTNGKFILGSNHLTIDQNASITGGDATEFIVTDGTGYLRQENIGSTDRSGNILFPVGPSITNYTPITITNAGTDDRIDVKVRPEVLEDGTTGTALTTDVLDLTWDIEEQTAGGSNVTMTFQWNGSNELTDFDRTLCYISHFGSAWNHTQPHGGAIGSDPYTRTVSNQSSFSSFSVGSNGVILPVELLYFKAQTKKKTVTLEWATATEINNDLFTIERSKNGYEFDDIIEINGKGNSSEESNYAAVDNEPYEGVSYYQLKQTDFDGKNSYSVIRAVEVKPLEGFDSMQIFPNPSSELISISGRIDRFEIMNLQGIKIDIKSLKILTISDTFLQMDISQLESGVYVIATKSNRGRFIKQ